MPPIDDDNNNNKIISLPLVSQHVQRRRRLMEHSLIHGGGHDSNNASSSALPIAVFQDRPRPHRYPRRRQNKRRLAAASSSSASPALEKDDDRHLVVNDASYNDNNPDQGDQLQQQQQQQVVSLFQGYGTHFVDLWVGSPVPQRQTLIVDTGSATTAFACSGCTPRRCGPQQLHTDPPFQEHLSNTFQAALCDDCVLGECRRDGNTEYYYENNEGRQQPKCTFGVSYQEGSNWTAFEAIDQVYVGGMHTQALGKKLLDDDGEHYHRHDGLDPLAAPEYAFPLRFGCQTQMSGHFRTQLEDGIMGMDIGRPAIWNQMYLQGKIAARAFALCFQRQPSRKAAGALTLGGTDARLHTAHPMVYAARSTSQDDRDGVFFSVHLRNVYLREGGGGDSVFAVGSKSSQPPDRDWKIVPVGVADVLVNEGQVIIDSGTTDTYLVHYLNEPFQRAWRELTGGATYSNNPVAYTEEEVDQLPTILLQFQGDDSSNEALMAGNDKNNLPLAGDLDPEHPLDVLLAIPPSHYMEYQPESRAYIAGFYFDEPQGSVLGANSMMLHDILFDVENNRIGWAESTCEYTSLVAPFLEKTNNKDETTTIIKKTPNLRMRPPGKPRRDKPVAAAPASKVGGVFGMGGGSGFCSSLPCRVGLASIPVVCMVTVVVVALVSRRKRRFKRRSSEIVSALPHHHRSLSGSSHSSHHNITNNSSNSTAPKVRRGGKRRNSNLTRSTSEVIPLARGSQSSDDTAGSDDSITQPSASRRFTRGQILRSRSNCHQFGVL